MDMTGGVVPVTEKGDLHDVDITGETEEGEEPTEQEKRTLKHIGDKFPKSAFLIAAVELCERFTCEHPLVSDALNAKLTFMKRLWLPRSIPELHQQLSRWYRWTSRSGSGSRRRHWLE